MSDKKGLSAFLQKNRKKANKPKPGGGPATADEVVEQAADQDVEVAQSQDQIPAKKANKDESSDEEEEEGQELTYGNIRDKKDVASAKQQDDKLKAGYGFDDKAEKNPSAGADGAEAAKKKNTASDIKFGGSRPKFGRGTKGKFGGEFSEGLDDLDDDGNVKKKTKVALPGNDSGAAADGAREFVNLSSSAKVGGQRDPEEEKLNERQPGVKPTFRGKANLTKTGGGGGQEEENAGVVTNYGFNVALRGPRTDDKQEEGKEGDDRQPRKDGRKNRDKGQPFGSAQNNRDDDDDGFEVVQDANAIRRQNRQRNQQHDSDSDDGFGGSRGGGRGTRGAPRGGGRGGFFKNSRRGGATAESKD